MKRQPCSFTPGEHRSHRYKFGSRFVLCPGVEYTREQRWDHALSKWITDKHPDGSLFIREATHEEIRTRCMDLADIEIYENQE